MIWFYLWFASISIFDCCCRLLLAEKFVQGVGDEAKQAQVTRTNICDSILRLVDIDDDARGSEGLHDKLVHDALENEGKQKSAHDGERVVVEDRAVVLVVSVIVGPLRVVIDVPERDRNAEEQDNGDR